MKENWKRSTATFLAVASVTSVPIATDWFVKELSFFWSFVISLGIAALLVISIYFLVPSFARRRKRRSFSKWMQNSYEKPVSILIFSFGPENAKSRDGQPSLLDQSLSFFKPKKLILLATDSSVDEARRVVVKIEKDVWEISYSEINPENIRSQIKRDVEGWVELEGEVVLDITGGTKSMSISTYQVAELEGYTAAYRVQGEDSKYEIYGSADS